MIDPGMIWWARSMADARAVIGDTETTGFGKKDRVIDYAFVDATYGTLLQSTLVNTDAPISAGALKVHGITKQMLAGKPNMGKAFESAINILGDRPILYWNAPFDARMIQQSIEEYGLIFNNRVWCLMEAFRIYGGFDKSIKLESACQMMGVEPGTHRAITDARAASGIFRGMIEGREPIPDENSLYHKEDFNQIEYEKVVNSQQSLRLS